MYIYIYISLLGEYAIEYSTRKFSNRANSAKNQIPGKSEVTIVFATPELILNHHQRVLLSRPVLGYW